MLFLLGRTARRVFDFDLAVLPVVVDFARGPVHNGNSTTEVMRLGGRK
jgi:hypothetical protein